MFLTFHLFQWAQDRSGHQWRCQMTWCNCCRPGMSLMHVSFPHLGLLRKYHHTPVASCVRQFSPNCNLKGYEHRIFYFYPIHDPHLWSSCSTSLLPLRILSLIRKYFLIWIKTLNSSRRKCRTWLATLGQHVQAGPIRLLLRHWNSFKTRPNRCPVLNKMVVKQIFNTDSSSLDRF